MRRKSQLTIILLTACSMSFSGLKAMVIGPDDTTVQHFASQVALSNGDRIAHFAELEAGFIFTGADVTALFDSTFPVTGNLQFNGGTLELQRDLILRDIANIVNLGNITGNNHSFDLAPTTNIIDGQGACVTWSDLALVLNGDLVLQNCCITFEGNSTINGRGNSLFIDPLTCTVQVGSNASLSLQNVTVLGVSGTNIQCVDDTGVLQLNGVNWVLSDDYSFTLGSFKVTRGWHIKGHGFNFNYMTNQISRIEAFGCLTLDYGLNFNYSPIAASNNLLSLVANSSQLVVRGATITAQQALQLTKGQLIVERHSYLTGANDTVDVLFGDGSHEDNNLDVHFFPAATLELSQVNLVYNEV